MLGAFCFFTVITFDNRKIKEWIYCVVESERNDNGDMIINGECFKKEDRIVLSLS